ncbi:MAG: hypothetical protein E7168_02640 [Firmicutes bacterium]|nr:hypothetical protein [Bacillota bacterium]
MDEIYEFYNKINSFSRYITTVDILDLKLEYNNLYISLKTNSLEKVEIDIFISDFENLESYIKKVNENFVKQEIKRVNYLLDDVNGYSLDELQKRVVVTDEINTLVIAGAGSGKSLTIVGKIRYLIEELKINPMEIIAISFTNDSTNSLKNSIEKNYHYHVQVYTFHKLALHILKGNNENILSISPGDYLEYFIDEYFSTTVFLYPKMMQKILRYFNIYAFSSNVKKKYEQFRKTKEMEMWKKLLSRFIHLFKSNAYCENDFVSFFLENKRHFYKKDYYRHKVFLNFSFLIYNLYQNELSSQGMVDFDDMIHLATNSVLDKGLPFKCSYLIIDEYQDTSYLRAYFVKAILEKTKSKFLAVGDDFQSIYRFSGCDLNIFLNFQDYFSNPMVMKIENTYRNSQQLIDVAGNFVMKNKNQLRKSLHSEKSLEKPIHIVYYENQRAVFKQLILDIYDSTSKSILILGRNNRDINDVIDSDFVLNYDGTLLFVGKKEISLRYLTVHKSKGLEEENVIVLHMENSVMGFPNQMIDDSVLKYVVCKEDKFLFSEERRLFYVAITRTKNITYLLTPKNNPSVFIKELLRDYKDFCNIIN